MGLDNITALAQRASASLQFLPIVLSSFLLSAVATWLCIRIALKLGIVDKPDNLVKTHSRPIPYLGGVGIFAGFIIGLSVSPFCITTDASSFLKLSQLMGLSAAAALICLIGVVDDVADLRPWQKILGQIAAAAILAVAGIRPSLSQFLTQTEQVSNWLDLAFGFVVMAIFVLGATNSVNLLDGIDGLCGSVTAINAIGMLLLAVVMQSKISGGGTNQLTLIIPLALFAAVCGFLLFNRHPAKIFMGDAGSLLIGMIFAAQMMLFAAVSPKWCLSSIVIFGLPILDTAVAFARRLLNKKPLFVSDRGHLYDQMIDRGFGLRSTVHIFSALACLYTLIGLIVSMLSAWWAIVVSAMVLIISIAVVAARGYLKMQGLRGAGTNIHNRN